MNYKDCTSCGDSLPATHTYFYKKRTGKYGITARCKKCILQLRKKEYQEDREIILKKRKIYQAENKKKIKKKKRLYYEKNKEDVLKKARLYYEENKEKMDKRGKQYYEENREGILKKAKRYYGENREKVIKRTRQYYEAHKEKRIEQITRYNQKREERFKKEKGIGYDELHKYIKRNKPRPEHSICTICNEIKKLECASIEHTYTKNPDDWDYLCSECHGLFDRCWKIIVSLFPSCL